MSDIHSEPVLHSTGESGTHGYGTSMHWPYCRDGRCSGCLPPSPEATATVSARRGNRPTHGRPMRSAICVGCPHCTCDDYPGEDWCSVCADCDDFFDGNPL